MVIKGQNTCEAYDIVKFAESHNLDFTDLFDLIYPSDPKLNILIDESFAGMNKKSKEVMRKFYDHHGLKGQLVICREIVDKTW